jgi:hypothetical protein
MSGLFKTPKMNLPKAAPVPQIDEASRQVEDELAMRRRRGRAAAKLAPEGGGPLNTATKTLLG